jgi:hypothetical protein
MRILVVVAVAVGIAALVSGCARQAYYYSPYPDYPPPTPELYGGSPPYDHSNGNGYYGGPHSGPPPYDYSNGNGYYGGPPYDHSNGADYYYGGGYYGNPYAYGGSYAEYWPTSSSVCWEPGRGWKPCDSGP